MATQIRIKPTDGGHEVLVLVEHPMDTGQQKKDGKVIPAHWIKKMSFALNGKEVAVADIGVAVSTDPLISILLKGAKAGDTVKVDWSDNLGKTGSAEKKVG